MNQNGYCAAFSLTLTHWAYVNSVDAGGAAKQRSGTAKLNNAKSRNSGKNAWPKMAWQEGDSNGQEISTPNPAHPHPRVLSPSGTGSLARRQNDG